MTQTQPDPNDLETVAEAETEFKANAMVIVLREAGIEAFAFGTGSAWLGGSMSLSMGGPFRVPVQVRRADLERARKELARNAQDSVDLDWDSVDVGERVDSVPLTSVGGWPMLARAAFVVAAAMVVIAVLAAIVVILF